MPASYQLSPLCESKIGGIRMMKIIWNDFFGSYYMYRYNRCGENETEKRSQLIKKVIYHQERILKIKLS